MLTAASGGDTGRRKVRDESRETRASFGQSLGGRFGRKRGRPQIAEGEGKPEKKRERGRGEEKGARIALAAGQLDFVFFPLQNYQNAP